MSAYQKLEERFGEHTAMKGVAALLNWDAATMMPEKGASLRAQQSAAIAVRMHQILSDPGLPDLFAAAGGESLNPWQSANLRVMKWLALHATAVPTDLVARRNLQESKTEMIWRAARRDNDFSAVAPALTDLLSIVRDVAAVKADKMDVAPYDSLLDAFAPGMTGAAVDALFDDLAIFLPPVIDSVLARQEKPIPLPCPVAITLQEKLNRAVAETLGFDFSGGRLDASTHPFSSGAGGDVRITTRYDENNPLSALQATLHETGHALYDRHTPEDWRGQPVGSANNMGMVLHESQSLSLDMQLGRHAALFEHIGPLIRNGLKQNGAAWSNDNLLRHSRQVSRGFIRVESDEATYPLHVILRTRLERDMIAGKLSVRDLPDAWNAGFKNLVGVTPASDQDGCLQDIHWYTGYFGYFPTYALGALLAAQLVATMEAEIPDVYDRVAQGEISAFTGWMRNRVQTQACLRAPSELIASITGGPLSSEAFKRHITRRYLS